jgi:AraC-like DNA-binding protein
MLGSMENIRETLIIGPRCSERFAPLEQTCCQPLRELRVVMCGISDLRGRYQVDRNDYPYHVVIFTLEGSGMLSFGDSKRKLVRGDLLVAPSGARFFYELAGPRWQILWFHLDRADRWRTLGSTCRVQRSHLFERLQRALLALLLETHDRDPDAQRAARIYSELLALDLKREIEPGIDPAQREVRARFALLWDEVNAGLGRAWTVNDLARRFGASVAHFHRLCLEHGGLSPKQMVFRLRMLRAEEILRNTNYALKSIAPTIGYVNAFAFSSAFKRHAGTSPKEYRMALHLRFVK